ncbi:MAG TPA: methyltransferase domain-containing protein [Bacteroidota bacterium]|nr:methyltransferase domain-containing protein [Bacteroidota bacterium]
MTTETPAYGQQEPMENEAMAFTLDTQARAIWPHEIPIYRKLFFRKGLEALDVGCGTGEISSRLVQEFSPQRVVGIDLAEANLRRAIRRFPPTEYPGLSFQQGDATALPFNDNTFDVALCRHMLQAVPDPLKVIHEMIRVVREGGRTYFLAEDYGMLFFYPTKYDTDDFFRDFGWKAAERSGSNLRQGRTMPTILTNLGCREFELNYLCIDTLRVDRQLLADIFMHWRDGFEEWTSVHSGRPLAEVRARFDDMIECTRSQSGYAAWLIPSVSARVNEAMKACSGNSVSR